MVKKILFTGIIVGLLTVAVSVKITWLDSPPKSFAQTYTCGTGYPQQSGTCPDGQSCQQVAASNNPFYNRFQCVDGGNTGGTNTDTGSGTPEACVLDNNSCTLSGARCCSSNYSCVVSPQGTLRCLPASAPEPLNKTYTFTVKAICANGNTVSNSLSVRGGVITGDKLVSEKCNIRSIGIDGSGEFNKSFVVSLPKKSTDTTATENACPGHNENYGGLYLYDLVDKKYLVNKTNSAPFYKIAGYSNLLWWEGDSLSSGSYTIEFYADEKYCQDNGGTGSNDANNPNDTKICYRDSDCASNKCDKRFVIFGYCVAGAAPSPTGTEAKLTCDPVENGKIDDADFELWKQEYTKQVTTTKSACLSSNKLVDLLGFQTWKDIYVHKTKQAF